MSKIRGCQASVAADGGARDISNNSFRTGARYSMTALTVGSVAPDFTLSSSDRTPVTLSSFRGSHNVLLAFFPMAFTGVCEAELCAFSDDVDQFAQAQTTVLGISVDQGPSLAAFKAQRGMTVELLSDSKRDVSRLYGTLNEEFFFSERAYFIVDKEGILRWSHVEDKLGDRRPNHELIAHLEALA